MSPIKFFLIAIVLGVCVYFGVSMGVSAQWFSEPSLALVIVGLNIIVTSVLYRGLYKVQGTPLFINGYLLSIVLKLVFYSGLLLTIRIVTPNFLTGNAILLMFCYFIFTILEVVVLFLRTGHK